MKRIMAVILALAMSLSLCACGGSADQPQASETPSPQPAEPVILTLLWHGAEIHLGEGFGDIPDCGDDNVEVLVDGEVVTDFKVKSSEPEVMSAERTPEGRICLTRLKSFEVRMIDFTVTYKGVDYGFKCNDDSWSPEFDDPVGGEGQPEDQLLISYPDEYAKFAERRYTDEELQVFIDSDMSFEEACDKLATVSDAVQYLYMRGYKFQPENQGSAAKLRYDLNSGACVGGSALLNALLEGDYDEQGYVYIFYARGEHVMPFFVLDGVYFYCDLVTVFNDGNADITRNPVSYMTKEPESFYDAWLEIEPHDLNDSESDMYLGIMYTTGYFGDPTMPQVWLWNSEDGKYSRIELSPEEKESQQIFFMREGYTFEF